MILILKPWFKSSDFLKLFLNKGRKFCSHAPVPGNIRHEHEQASVPRSYSFTLFVIVFMRSTGEVPMGEVHELTQKIKRKAIELGFARVGVTTADPIEGYEEELCLMV